MDALHENKKNVLLIYGVYLAIFIYPVGSIFIYSGIGYNAALNFYSRLFIWFELLVIYLYARNVEKNVFLLCREKRYGFWFYPASFGALLLLHVGIAAILVLLTSLFGWHNNEQVSVQISTVLSKNMPLLFFSAITAGITEELIFRGYLLPRLEMLFKNRYMPVIVSALMFSLNHYHYFSIDQLISTFLFGVVFAIHYLRYRNIKILIFIHALFDLCTLLLFRLLHGDR